MLRRVGCLAPEARFVRHLRRSVRERSLFTRLHGAKYSKRIKDVKRSGGVRSAACSPTERSEAAQRTFARKPVAAVHAVGAPRAACGRVSLFEAASDRNTSVHGAPAVRTTANGHGRSMVIVVRAAVQAMHRSTSATPNSTARGLEAQDRDRDSASRCPSRTSAQKRARVVDARRSSPPLRSICRKSRQA